MTEIAGGLFRGSGAIIVQLALLGVADWLFEYIATALGKGQIAQLIRMATLFIGFTLAAGTLWSALLKVAQVLGIG